MNFIDSGSSQQSTEKQNPNEKPTKHHLRGQDSSFSSGSPLSVNSRQNAAVNQDYVLTECQKLILKGKYSKAFINLRRHLMNAEVEYHLRPQFYSQLVHTSLKLCEKYLSKGLSKSQQKIPLLLQICYSYLEKWEQYLTGFQENSSSSESGSSRSFNSSENGKDHSPNKQQNEDDFIVPSHLQLKARQTIKYSELFKGLNSGSQVTLQELNGDGKEENKSEADQAQPENPKDQDQIKNQDPEQGQQETEQQMNKSQEIPQNKIIQKNFNQMFLDRELFLCSLLRTLFASYIFHSQEENKKLALAFLFKGSKIIREFLTELVFIQSSELCRISAKIELLRSIIHFDNNQTDLALAAIELSVIFGRRCLETWLKIIEKYSYLELPVKIEQRCEKSVKELLIILLTKCRYQESKGLLAKALLTAQISDWLAQNLLFYEQSSILKKMVNEKYTKMTEKYAKIKQEIIEANQIFHQFFIQGVQLESIQEKNQLDRLKTLQNMFNKYIYLKSNNNELNQLRRVIVRNRSVSQYDRNEQLDLMRSKFNNRSQTVPRKENLRFQDESDSGLRSKGIVHSGVLSFEDISQYQEFYEIYSEEEDDLTTLKHSNTLGEIPTSSQHHLGKTNIHNDFGDTHQKQSNYSLYMLLKTYDAIKLKEQQEKELQERVRNLRKHNSYMRENKQDEKYSQVQKDIRYKYQKIPLEKRKDLLDSDFAVRKFVLACLGDQDYAEQHAIMEITIENEQKESKQLHLQKMKMNLKKIRKQVFLPEKDQNKELEFRNCDSQIDSTINDAINKKNSKSIQKKYGQNVTFRDQQDQETKRTTKKGITWNQNIQKQQKEIVKEDGKEIFDPEKIARMEATQKKMAFNESKNILKNEFEKSLKISIAIEECSDWFKTKGKICSLKRENSFRNKTFTKCNDKTLQKTNDCKAITRNAFVNGIKDEKQGNEEKIENIWKIPFDIRDYSDLSASVIYKQNEKKKRLERTKSILITNDEDESEQLKSFGGFFSLSRQRLSQRWTISQAK